MLDIGWSEMAVIALVALVVIGPKDLPKAMRAVAFWVRKGRRLASEFHSGIDQILREAELDEARDAIRSAGQINLNREIENTIDPTGDVTKAFTAPGETLLPATPATPPAPTQPTPQPASAAAEPAAASPAPQTNAAPEPAAPPVTPEPVTPGPPIAAPGRSGPAGA
jgi:sec-independent protein translocase protein TatB